MSRNSKITSSEKKVRLKRDDSSINEKKELDEVKKKTETIKWLLTTDPQSILSSLDNPEDEDQFLMKISELSEEIHKLKTQRLIKSLTESKDPKYIIEILLQQIAIKNHKQTDLPSKVRGETSQRIFLLFECGFSEEVQFTVECVEIVQDLKVVSMTLEVCQNEFCLYKYDGSEVKSLNRKAVEKCFKLMGLQTGLDTGVLFGLLLRTMMITLCPKFSFFADVFDETACKEYANVVNKIIKLAVNKLRNKDVNTGEQAPSEVGKNNEEFDKMEFFTADDFQEGDEDEWDSECEEDEDEAETHEGEGSDSI